MSRDDIKYTESAKAAGLRYVTDGSPGIRRKRAGKGFTYLDPKGRRITNRTVVDRIERIVIPPAWTDVWISPTEDGHIQATGRDAKGRKQYRYHRRYRAIRDDTKFERILEFSRVFREVREHVERDLSLPGLPRRKVLAAVVRLLETTLIRVGNDGYARENQSYGLTTLRDHHAEVNGSKVTFDFRGKSGVEHAVSITDQRLARIIQRCQDLPGEELFGYLDDEGRHRSVGSGDINDYLGEITGGDFTAKDFRTWAGTVLAAGALRDLGVARSEAEVKKNIGAATTAVAARLGNTKAVCRDYYIHPKVIASYRAGRVIPAPAAPTPVKRGQRRATAGLRRDEIAVLEMLEVSSEQ